VKSVIVGTAGHIDHGKTSLVKALTGIDADRLEEEKRRGITIDLGFAHMQMEGLRIGFIDVPGHEKFVRNMLAGVGGIDLVVFVIAADEGVMPQTREHFEICRLLGIERGIVVLTKSDAVDAETLDVVRLEVSEFFRGTFLDPSRAPMLAVSSKTTEGIDALRSALQQVANEVRAKSTESLLRLPVDRVFTMHGFGTVVTGTLISGMLGKEQEVEVVPARKRARVRGLQVHGASAERAVDGERTAVNLAGVAKEELHRGQTLISPATLAPTHRFEAWIELSGEAKPLKDRARVHLHAFTAEVIAEVALHGVKELKPGGQAFAQLRISKEDEAMLLLPGDRFIMRQFSPVITIGGGRVLDAHPQNKRLSGDALQRFLTVLRDGTPEEQLFARVQRRGAVGLDATDAVRDTGWTAQKVRETAERLLREKRVVHVAALWMDAAEWSTASERVLAELKRFHEKNPLAQGIGRELLREKTKLDESAFAELLQTLAAKGQIVSANELVHLAGHKVVMRSEESQAQTTIDNAFRSAGLAVPALKDVLNGLKIDRIRAQKIVALLLRDKVLVKVNEELVFHHTALDALKQILQTEKAKSPRLDVARFKDLTGISRKYAIPLLEWLDRERVTRRVGDARQIL
jgi:selenocysteine-specific elongation factor